MSLAQDLSKEILNEMELEAVLRFKADRVMFEAVKKYVLAYCYEQGVVKPGEPHKGNINYALQLAWHSNSPTGTPRTDAELGQVLRALAHAVQIVESGFKELADMEKSEKLEENPINEAE